MPIRTPKEVVEAYNYELWNKQNYLLGDEILADEVIRHYPGAQETMTKSAAIERVEHAYREIFSDIEFVIHKLFAEGEFVTLLWEMHATYHGGEIFTYSNIEVFRVVDGRICEFWNPPQVEEANGVWQ